MVRANVGGVLNRGVGPKRVSINERENNATFDPWFFSVIVSGNERVKASRTALNAVRNVSDRGCVNDATVRPVLLRTSKCFGWRINYSHFGHLRAFFMEVQRDDNLGMD